MKQKRAFHKEHIINFHKKTREVTINNTDCKYQFAYFFKTK
jgi:hypothetical protein